MPNLSFATTSYYFLRVLTAPLRVMPYSWIHALGRVLGKIAFYSMRQYRKRALSNLAMASDLGFTSKQALLKTAKRSFENLAINVLEYARFDAESDFSRVIHCENPQMADTFYQSGKGIIFFCGHQSNWEALFLDGTSRMKGVAIGRPIKNKKLYHWIVSIREKKGGSIITPRNALKEGLRALKKGYFLGIVGDQGMPDSGYSFPFLGRRAWNSTAPALLAYKTNCPIIVASTRRVKGGYRIRYSDPIFANQDAPMDLEVVRMMNEALTLLQESIKLNPGEWLWQHNRWKQQTPGILHRPYRFDSIALILPDDAPSFHAILPHLPTFKTIYPNEFLFLFVPLSLKETHLIEATEFIYYQHPQELLVEDYRFKLVFNFSTHPVAKHFERLSAFDTLDLHKLTQLAAPHLPKEHQGNLSEILKRALSRPGTLWKQETNHVP